MHVPARRQQPVDDQQAREAGLAQQIPRVLPRGGRRRGGMAVDRDEARDGEPGERQRGEREEREAKAADVDQRSGEHRADDVGERRRKAEPREDLLQRRRVARHPAGGALDRDQADVGAGAGEDRSDAEDGERAPRQQRRDDCGDAAACGQDDGDADRQVVAMAVGEPAGGKRERDRRRREEAEQDADRPGRVAFAQRRERRRHPHAGHARVQRDLAADQRQQRARQVVAARPAVAARLTHPRLRGCAAAATGCAARAAPRRSSAGATSRWCAAGHRRSCWTPRRASSWSWRGSRRTARTRS